MSKKKSRSFIGIDVSKQLLEVAVYENSYHFSCPNKVSAFTKLLAELVDSCKSQSVRSIRARSNA